MISRKRIYNATAIFCAATFFLGLAAVWTDGDLAAKLGDTAEVFAAGSVFGMCLSWVAWLEKSLR